MRLVPVKGAHIVQVGLRNFRFVFPTVAGLHHALYAGAVSAVHAAEHPEGGDFSCLLWTQPLTDQYPFCLHNPRRHLVGKGVVTGCGCHLHGAVDEEKARCGDVTQLPAGLHHHIDARTAQLTRRDQPKIRHPPESVTKRLHAQHVKHLRDGCPFGLDELPAPERVAHLARQAVVMPLPVKSDSVLRKHLPLLPRSLRRCILRIDAVQVASGRQRIGIDNGVTAG